MKNILKFVFCALVITSAVNCSEQPQATIKYSIKDIVSNSKPITMSDMGAVLESIKLKTPKDIIIATVSKVITTPSSIYICTYVPVQAYRFDRDGNYMNKISTKGRARNEYNSITSIFLNTEENICIQDEDRVITYTPEGEFINSTTMGQVSDAGNSRGFRNMYMDKQGNLFESFMIIAGNEKNNLIVTNPTKDTLLANPNPFRSDLTEGFSFIADYRTVYHVADKIAYHQQYCDTVYTYDQTTSLLKPRFYFANHNPATNEDFKDIFKSVKERVSINDITEDNKYIYVNISDKNIRQLYLIDKKSGESFEADFKLNHPEDDELAFYPRWESNEEFIFFYDVTQTPEPTMLLMQKL